MYNSTEITFDKELTTLSYETSINAEFDINEIQYSDLWEIEEINDNLIKAIPLFNCDEIISNNSDDIVLEENKCIILEKDDDTIIKCVSDDKKEVHFHNTNLYTYIPYTDPTGTNPQTIYGILADEYMNPLVNAEIEVLVDDELETIIKTDNQGVCEYEFTYGTTVSFRYNKDRQYYII